MPVRGIRFSLNVPKNGIRPIAIRHASRQRLHVNARQTMTHRTSLRSALKMEAKCSSEPLVPPKPRGVITDNMMLLLQLTSRQSDMSTCQRCKHEWPSPFYGRISKSQRLNTKSAATATITERASACTKIN
jgi:hypothetical protein